MIVHSSFLFQGRDFDVLYNAISTCCHGARGGIVVKALRYKPAGRGFYSQWCH
jgi:hypothetical protein